MSTLAQKLPWDVLQEIFTQALFPPVLREDNTEQTMRLCQICSHWRNVMLGSSPLWQYIRLEMLPQPYIYRFTFPTGPARIASIDLLKWWLKNLGSYIGPRIEVVTKYKRVESGQDSRIFDEDHELFLQLLSSARSLHIDFHSSSDLDFLLRSTEVVFKNLEEICVCPMPGVGLSEGWRRNHGVLIIPIRILNVKSLRAINFTSRRDATIRWSPASHVGYQSSWNLLTQVQIEKLIIDVHEWAVFIRGFTALERGCFTVQFRCQVLPNLDSQPVVCLPHLRKLKLGWPGYTNLGVNPLQNLELPALKWLTLLVPEGITITWINQILLFTPRLLRLSIDSQWDRFPYLGGDFEPLWGYAPALEELLLTYAAPGPADWFDTSGGIHRVWMEELLTSRWLDLHQPGRNFRLLKLYQEASKTDGNYATLQSVIDDYMSFRERSYNYSICLQEHWHVGKYLD